MPPARRLLGYLRPYRLRYAAGAGCLVLATALALGIPWSLRGGVDALAARDLAAVRAHALLIVGLAVAQGLARLGSRFTIIGAGQWVERDLRRDLFAHLTRLGPDYYAAQRAGDLVSRASSDVAAVRMVAGFGVAMLVQTTLLFGGALVAMAALDPWLTLWALAPYPLLIGLSRRASHRVEAEAAAVQEQLGALSARVQENLAGAAVVRAYTMEARELAAFDREHAELVRRSLRLARTQALAWPLLGAIGGVGTLVVLWAGGAAVIDRRLSLGTLVAFSGYMAQLAWPTIALGWTLASVRRGLASLGRIAQVLETPPPPDAASGAPPARLPRGPLAVEFAGLTFAYGPEREPALREVSFAVPPGALVAVVGPTGSGKSTLASLLARLWEPPPGTVRLGGVDVRRVPRAELRRAIGWVPQEPFLFSRSVEDNVRLGEADAAPAAVEAALAAAGLAREVASLPEGRETVVGERGVTLSGGQRQRIALARALVPDPRVLVLDDPFASVDPGMEAEIWGALRAIATGRTTLLITHRLRAARDADRVVVLVDGRVVEAGRHEALLAADGTYARLWRRQQLEEAIARG